MDGGPGKGSLRRSCLLFFIFNVIFRSHPTALQPSMLLFLPSQFPSRHTTQLSDPTPSLPLAVTHSTFQPDHLPTSQLISTEFAQLPSLN
jgi:hypothetical protein